MAIFLFSATNSNGEQIVDRIESSNLNNARNELEKLGYLSITFYDDNNASDLQKLIGTDHFNSEVLSPETQLEFLRNNNITSSIIYGFKITFQYWIFLIIFTLIGLIYYPITGFMFWIGIIAIIVWLVSYAYTSLPTISFNLLIGSSKRAKWKNLRFYAQVIKLLNKIGPIKINEFEIDMNIATSYAAEGEFSKAKNIIDYYDNNSEIPKGLLYPRIISIYDKSRNFNKIIECYEKSLEITNNSSTILIDYTFYSIFRFNDLTKAKELLAQINEVEISEAASIYLSICKAMILIEDNNLFEAQFHLAEALRKAKLYSNNIFYSDVLDFIKLASIILNAKLGDKKTAAKLYKQIEKQLLAHNEFEIAHKCESLIS